MSRLSKECLADIRRRFNLDGFPESGHGSFYILLKHIDALELELKAAKQEELEAVRKYGELELQQPKKVGLPKDVVKAIEYYRFNCKFTLRSFARLMYRDEGADDNAYTKTLKRYIQQGGGELFMQALVNDYTVEQTKEDRLREGIEAIRIEWENEPSTEAERLNWSLANADLVIRIADFVIKFNAGEA